LASLTLLIGRIYKHFSTGANDLVFATVKLMILPLYVLQLISNYLTESYINLNMFYTLSSRLLVPPNTIFVTDHTTGYFVNVLPD